MSTLDDINIDEKFDDLLKTYECTPIIIPKCQDLNIVTITNGFNFCSSIDIINVFNRLEKDDNIQYIYINEENVRGYKKIKKISNISNEDLKKDKRKKNKGKSFHNQLSIGFNCNNKTHNHINAISIKIFNTGKIQMTGCKSKQEIYHIYNYILDKIYQIPNSFVFKNQVFKYNIIRDIIKTDLINIKYNMILIKIDINYNINQLRFSEFINNNFNDIYCSYNQNISTVCQLYLNNFKYSINDKEFIPSCQVYNSSLSLRINNYDKIFEIYNFLKSLLINHYLDFRDFNYILPNQN